jgi:hypothetical protein
VTIVYQILVEVVFHVTKFWSSSAATHTALN